MSQADTVCRIISHLRPCTSSGHLAAESLSATYLMFHLNCPCSLKRQQLCCQAPCQLADMPCVYPQLSHGNRCLNMVSSLQTPVRAVVLPLLQHEAALQLHTAVRHALQQLLADESIWYQDPTMMHATIYHASDYKVRHASDYQLRQNQVAKAHGGLVHSLLSSYRS